MKYCLIVFLIFSLVSCINGQTTTEVKSFEKDILDNRKGKLTGIYERLRYVEKVLKLDTIGNGYDSLQIRFWFSFGLIDTQQVVILKKREGNWSGEICKFIGTYYKNTDSLIRLDKKMDNLIPRISWENTIDSLLSNDLLILPTSSKLPTYDIPNDPSEVIVEVSTSKIYRVYSYPVPYLQKGISEATNMEKIINILIDDFGITLIQKV